MTSGTNERANGFSLIELLVVVSIIVIVSAASIPMGLNFVRHYQVTGAAQNVAAQMQMSRGQSVKRNTQRGMLLNFNYPAVDGYQWTSLDPSPWDGTWDGGVYPNYAPLRYTEGDANFGVVPMPPDNTRDPDPANGVMSPHGVPIAASAGDSFRSGRVQRPPLPGRRIGPRRQRGRGRRGRRHGQRARFRDSRHRPAHQSHAAHHHQPQRPSDGRGLGKELLNRRRRMQPRDEIRKPASRDAGFSLIEVMIAIVILTVGLLSLAQTMVVATNANSLSGRMTSCSALAKEQLERLKATPFYTDAQARLRNPLLTAGGDINATVGGYSQLYDQDGLPANAAGLFEVRWQITDIATALPLEMVRIDMRCLPAAGMGDQFAIIGEARFTTFRTANVG